MLQQGLAFLEHLLSLWTVSFFPVLRVFSSWNRT